MLQDYKCYVFLYDSWLILHLASAVIYHKIIQENDFFKYVVDATIFVSILLHKIAINSVNIYTHQFWKIAYSMHIFYTN